MSKTVVFFRGRSTAAIMEDARRLGLLCEQDRVIIVKRRHDQLAEPGDVLEPPFPIWGELVVVCNGGTTEQQVPTIVNAMQHCVSPGPSPGVGHDDPPFGRTLLVELTDTEVRELWSSGEAD